MDYDLLSNTYWHIYVTVNVYNQSICILTEKLAWFIDRLTDCLIEENESRVEVYLVFYWQIMTVYSSVLVCTCNTGVALAVAFHTWLETFTSVCPTLFATGCTFVFGIALTTEPNDTHNIARVTFPTINKRYRNSYQGHAFRLCMLTICCSFPLDLDLIFLFHLT